MSEVKGMLAQQDTEVKRSKNVPRKPLPSNEAASYTSEVLKAQASSTSMIPEKPPTNMPAAIPKPIANTTVSSGGHEICIAAGQINSMGVQLAELSLRLAKIELRITNWENNDDSDHLTSPAEFKSATQQLRSIRKQVEFITDGLRSTPGYNIGRIFNCSSCGSSGVVAVKVKCANCGQENWWGRWPLRKKVNWLLYWWHRLYPVQQG